MSTQRNCFGFWGGDAAGTACTLCKAKSRCRAILVSDGFQILGDLVDNLVQSLPDGVYRNTDRIPELVAQLKEPPQSKLSDEEAELIGLLGPGADNEALANL